MGPSSAKLHATHWAIGAVWARSDEPAVLSPAPTPTLVRMKHTPILIAFALAASLEPIGGAVAADHGRAITSQRPESDKLDPAVRAAVDSGHTTQVIVLGRTQLLEPVGGLETFASTHANRPRLALRAEVVAKLKKSAHDEQATILAALGRRSAMRSLWIVNAMVLSLSPDEIRRIEKLEPVRFVYPSAESIPVAESPSRVSLVLKPTVRTRFDATGKRIAWNVERLDAPRVWRELGIAGEGVVIAVLDIGVNYAHTDLRGNMWVNTKEIPGNGIDDDRNGYIDDVYGYDFARMRAEVRDTNTTPLQHGTMTSGITLGDGSGGIITGVAPRARLMPMIGSGVTAAALGYQYALDNGADIVSMSFSIPNLGNVRGVWRMMSDHAVAAGLVLVGGAGNFRTTATIPYQHQSPKDVPSVISVAGVDSALQLVPFSSGGPAEWGTVALYGDYPLPAGLVKPDVVAFPGAGYPVLASADSGYVDPNTRIRGNSFSGPQGAGVAALMLSANPTLQAWRVKQIMEQTAHDLGPPGKDNDFGAGLIDSYAAVKAVRGLP